MTTPLPGSVPLLGLSPRTSVRFVITYREVRRGLFWINVGRDGSVYLGLSRVVSSSFVGSKRLDANNSVQVNVNEGTPVTPEDLKRHGHFSFHPSGQNNSAGMTTMGESWRDMAAPRNLCIIALEEPVNYPPLPHARDRDMDLYYHGDGTRPLVAALYVLPSPQVLPLSSTEEEVGVAFNVADGLDGISPLVVQVVLRTNPPGPWPEKTIVGSLRKVPQAD